MLNQIHQLLTRCLVQKKEEMNQAGPAGAGLASLERAGRKSHRGLWFRDPIATGFLNSGSRLSSFRRVLAGGGDMIESSLAGSIRSVDAFLF
jgi:hypothetical protein